MIPVNLLSGAVLAVFRPGPRDGVPWVGILGLAWVLVNGVVGWFHPFGPVMGVVTTLTVWSFATTRMPVPRPMTVLVLCGKWSYGIYLVHLPFCGGGLRAAQRLGLEAGPRAVYVGVAALVGNAWARRPWRRRFTTSVERPVLARRPWVTNRPWARRLAAAVQVSLVPAGVAYWLATGGWHRPTDWGRRVAGAN